jgi:hypothetical protein
VVHETGLGGGGGMSKEAELIRKEISRLEFFEPTDESQDRYDGIMKGLEEALKLVESLCWDEDDIIEILCDFHNEYLVADDYELSEIETEYAHKIIDLVTD